MEQEQYCISCGRKLERWETVTCNFCEDVNALNLSIDIKDYNWREEK